VGRVLLDGGNGLRDTNNFYSTNRKFYQENKLNIENINWNDVGGLSEIKQIIIDTILLPLQYPLLFSSNEKVSFQ
jgi:sulfonate transport system substrate-binding protein